MSPLMFSGQTRQTGVYVQRKERRLGTAYIVIDEQEY